MPGFKLPGRLRVANCHTPDIPGEPTPNPPLRRRRIGPGDQLGPPHHPSPIGSGGKIHARLKPDAVGRDLMRAWRSHLIGAVESAGWRSRRPEKVRLVKSARNTETVQKLIGSATSAHPRLVRKVGYGRDPELHLFRAYRLRNAMAQQLLNRPGRLRQPAQFGLLGRLNSSRRRRPHVNRQTRQSTRDWVGSERCKGSLTPFRGESVSAAASVI